MSIKQILILLLIVILVAAGIMFINYSSVQKPMVTIDNHRFNVEIAKTLTQKEKGLGDRNYLALNSGMLFPFPTSGEYGFWMKDMKFPLDIIYINNNKIVSIYTLSKPQNNINLRVVYPTTPANNVLEINAGLAKNYNFKVGDQVSINL